MYIIPCFVLAVSIQERPGYKRQSVEHQVAFDAKMLATDTPLLHNQDIVFDTVQINVGGAYNKHHGVFIAPVSGVYHFTATIMSVTNVVLHCSISVNGQDKARLFGYDPATSDQATQSLTISLNKGDDVSVRAIDAGSTVLRGQLYSSFSGFLLYELGTAIAQL